MDIAGKVAVVTGSGGAGSGRAIAKLFARNGAHVVVSDVDDEGGAATVDEITVEGGSALYQRADVRNEGDVAELIAFAQRSFGPLSVMVNNASGPGYRPDLPLDFWDETIATELVGAMYGVRHAIVAMQTQGGGAIVNVSSTSALEFGRLRPVGSPAYDAAKAGILHFTMGLRFLTETSGIRVSCVVPHWIASPGPKEYYDSLMPEEREALGVPAELISLEAMAEAVLRLATDESLAGRALMLWGGRDPTLIALGDRGYESLEELR